MKILIVTGQLAFENVQKAATGFDADVLRIETPVASLITPQKLIAGFLSSSFASKKYDAALISGFSKFDFKRAESELKIPIYLGPKHAADLESVLKSAENAGFSFSKTVPACEFIQSQKQAKTEKLLLEYEQKSMPALRIGSLAIGGCSKMKVLGEIANVEDLSRPQLKETILSYISNGADIVDLGFSPEAAEDTVQQLVSFSKTVSAVPVSVDSGQFSQIIAGISAGADMVLSLNSEMIHRLNLFFQSGPNENRRIDFESFCQKIKKTTFVVIPDFVFDETNFDSEPDFPSEMKGSFSKLNARKIQSLEENIRKAKAIGLEKLIADLILSPPNHHLLESAASYFEFHRKNPHIPILFGVGNVTELIDADSPGANALLSVIASECGASILFTPEASAKTKGSVSELKKAADMVLASKIRSSAPKDLGIDLLYLKEKRRRPGMDLDFISAHPDLTGSGFSKSNLNASSFVLTGTLHPDFIPGTKWGWKNDPAGNFFIGLVKVSELSAFVRSINVGSESERQAGTQIETQIEIQFEKLKNIQTPNREVIVAVHPKKIIIGTDSAFMMEKIIQENLITELSHAAYLGRELQKAEIAMNLGRSYAQDDAW
ncbi:dihydropteroate synthase-like protein [Methanolapillus millepedarum]|uniref:Pterin-binding domain-containing protein n=1 Tax=Methanolapillus millepedarum TaxID=3028296 RepID=A0AA96V3X9_9EURY|nr:hypothetical protein MsAc7_05880 [Methanosarcinaceae archaeon Ac7]